MIRQVTILGSTGSIGQSTLDVIARHPDRFGVFALTAHNSVDTLAEQCRRFRPRYAVVSDRDNARRLREMVSGGITVLQGENALAEVAADTEVDIVMAAIVGAAGLLPTLAAAERGKRILLANKEALVMAGALFMDAVRDSGATLLPIDSEHNAIFQCLPNDFRTPSASGVSKILLSASGGPFRTAPLDSLAGVTPDQACAHPNWSMGRKISVDSATMMNKGLEVIEACWLFDLSPDQVEVVIHPQSVVHSLVAYIDGSMLAQLGNPDMRTPIAHGLAWPERIDAGVSPLDLVDVAQLAFEHPDMDRFPCLHLAQQAARAGGDYPAALNAANEVAVGAFLAGAIAFTDIARVVSSVVDAWQPREPVDLASVQQSDKLARHMAGKQLEVFARC